MTDLALHPWNRDFIWQDHGAEPTTLAPAEVEQFDRDGFFVRPGVFSPEELKPIIDELDAFEAKADAFLRSQEQGRMYIAESGAITFAPHLVASSPVLAEFVRHPALLGICSDLIGTRVRLYHDQAVYKKPEKPRRFPWHQDNGYKFIEPQAYLTCWIALTDATLDNGCPQVATGVHRHGTLRHTYVDPLGWECFDSPPTGQPVPAPVGAGGVVVFSSLTPHLTGPNTTGNVRKAYIVQYAPEGAVALTGEPDAGAAAGHVLQHNDSYQFPVLP